MKAYLALGALFLVGMWAATADERRDARRTAPRWTDAARWEK